MLQHVTVYTRMFDFIIEVTSLLGIFGQNLSIFHQHDPLHQRWGKKDKGMELYKPVTD